MTAMRASDRGDILRMTGRGDPVMNRGPDAAALDRRLARPMMPGNQQENPFTAGDRLFERAVDRRPGAIQIHAVEVEHPVRLDRAAAQPLVPASIERLVCDRNRFPSETGRRTVTRSAMVDDAGCGAVMPLHRLRRSPFPNRGRPHITRKRPDRCCDASPELGLIRVERAHGLLCPSAPGSTLRR